MALHHYPVKTGRGASSSGTALKMNVVIPSGPSALCFLKSFSNFFTSFGFIETSCIEGEGLGPLSGMLYVMCTIACRRIETVHLESMPWWWY